MTESAASSPSTPRTAALPRVADFNRKALLLRAAFLLQFIDADAPFIFELMRPTAGSSLPRGAAAEATTRRQRPLGDGSQHSVEAMRFCI
jgi:hypothetical protein